MRTFDYIIVGQGLAGTLLGYFLEKSGKRILFVDNGYKTAASTVAAGIFNPITGRRFVKSWMIDTLFPFAKETYAEIEREINQQIFYPNHIIRALFNHVEENHWLMRSDLPENLPYVEPKEDYGRYKGRIQEPYSYMELRNAGRADILGLIQAFRKKWLSLGRLVEEQLNYELLDIRKEGVFYKDLMAPTMIFCEGYMARENPHFSYLNYNPTKGELLLVKIPNVDFRKMLKHKLYIVPFGDDIYWVGATNDWNNIDDIPTAENRKYLEDRLQSFLKVPFEVLEHKAAVRPTVKDRRPYLGLHPKYPQLAIFNGLGTKGASLGPYWAQHFSDFLCGHSEIDSQVDIQRIKSK